MEVEEETAYDKAVAFEDTNPEQTIEQLQAIIAQVDTAGDLVKMKEASIYKLGELYAKLERPQDVGKLLVSVRPFFNSVPKAKTAKIVRTLIDLVGKIPDSTETQAEFCRECIAWCKEEKRTFLKQRIQARLADLFLKMKRFHDAIKLITTVRREVKKIDDKLLLVEIEIIETRVHHFLQNIPKAKGCLTSARTSANSIYCPPALQARIDEQAGIICAEEKDYKTSFSYFYEAFESYNTCNRPDKAVMCLKYMLLSKIMSDHASDVYSIINGKAGLKYAGVEVNAMKEVADAHKERSIHKFEAVLKKYKKQLADDPIIFSHLNLLQEKLLEQNLIRLIEPFSSVEVTHIAELIGLPARQIEAKLSEMILDEKFNGTLDQGAGVLVVFDEVEPDLTMNAAVETIKELNLVVDKLYAKAQKLHSN